ncbi:AAA family ATPase [Enterobacter ludwigii]|nr:AAA family ATPase [Enterobacter ludwigii]
MGRNDLLIRTFPRHEPYELDCNNLGCDISTLESKDSLWGHFPFAFEISHVGENIQSLFLDMAFDSVIGYKDAQLGLARIQSILTKITGKDFGKITVSSSPYRVMVFESVGRLESLSQGEMDILVTISSIVKRQIFIYGKYTEDDKKLLGLDDFFKVPGFVLIDEVDLHLHPRAQEKYIKVLIEIFPNITFILTTHSPFVIRGLPDNSVVVSLPSGEVYKENFKAMDIDSITNIIFGYAGSFSEDVRSKLNTFKILLIDENKNIEELKNIYNALVTSESAKEEMDLLLASYSNIDVIREIK